MSELFERLNAGLHEVEAYLKGKREGYRVTEFPPFGGMADEIAGDAGDAPEFLATVRAIATGVARNYRPKRLYVVRIDNWFGPRWLYFSGKILGAFGVWKKDVTLPPFVPQRVRRELRFEGPDYRLTGMEVPLHVECTSAQAMERRVSEIDEDAAFVWFSSESEQQKRGAMMVYLPVSGEDSGFYVSFAENGTDWRIATMRGISRGEVAELESGSSGGEPASAAKAAN